MRTYSLSAGWVVEAMAYHLFLFYFLNQRFITRGAKAGLGSYFVTTLSRTKEEKNKKEKREKKRKEGKKKERKKEGK